MHEHFTWFSYLPLSPNGQKFATAIFIFVVLVALTRAASARLSGSNGIKNALVPESKLSLFTFFDFFVEAFVSYQDGIMDKAGRKYLPITGTVFLFVFTANLLGLVPGMPSATTTVWVTVGLALVTFFSFVYYGIKEHGAFGYLKHFWGPIWWMGFLVFPLEILSHLLRILTLNLRLYWNISADHIVLGIFTEMTKVIIPVAFYALGTFVCFMQAFIFATLTMVYIRIATEHEEGHEHSHEH